MNLVFLQRFSHLFIQQQMIQQRIGENRAGGGGTDAHSNWVTEKSLIKGLLSIEQELRAMTKDDIVPGASSSKQEPSRP